MVDDFNTILDIDRGMADKYMTFAVGKEAYGLEIEYISEIIMVQTITEVPEVPGYIKGIINLRGKILPVMDIRVRFNKDALAYNDRTCIIVAIIDGTLIGLIVDTVNAVMDIDPKEITDPANSLAETQNRYIRGIGKTESGVVLLLDLDRLVTER